MKYIFTLFRIYIEATAAREAITAVITARGIDKPSAPML